MGSGFFVALFRVSEMSVCGADVSDPAAPHLTEQFVQSAKPESSFQ